MSLLFYYRRDSGLSRVLGSMTKLFSKNLARSTDLLFLKSLVGSNHCIQHEKALLVNIKGTINLMLLSKDRRPYSSYPQKSILLTLTHGVWKSQKKYHLILRAKRATFTFWIDILKMPKIVHFCECLKTWSLWSNSVTRHVSFNRTKIGGKCQNSKIQMGHSE